MDDTIRQEITPIDLDAARSSEKYYLRRLLRRMENNQKPGHNDIVHFFHFKPRDKAT